MALYHKDLGIPQTLQRPLVGIELVYSRHAKDKATQLNLEAPKHLPDHTLVELEVINGQVTKWVVRFALSAYDDMVLVIQPDRFVRTLWRNANTDTHKTLNRSAYTVPQA